MKKAIRTPAKPKSKRVMVLYGLDDSESPRAAVFGEPNFKLARKAAGLMNLTVHVGLAAEFAQVLKGIRPGRIYGTGSGFVPHIKPKRYEELVQALRPETATDDTSEGKIKLPRSWSAIEIGDQVLAQGDEGALGWWDTKVEQIDGDMLSLRSCDFPDITLSRHRLAVALRFTSDYAPPRDISEVAPGLPTDWTDLKAGQLILAHEGTGEGWWEALIVDAKGTQVVVRWRDYSKPAKFTRSLVQTALLYPKAP
jgi:hypothetical protein